MPPENDANNRHESLTAGAEDNETPANNPPANNPPAANPAAKYLMILVLILILDKPIVLLTMVETNREIKSGHLKMATIGYFISIAVEGVLVIMVCWFARSAIKNELRRLKNKLRRPKNKLRRPKNIGASFRFMGESNAAGASSGNATQATTVHV